MSETWDLDRIREFWDSQARTYRDAPEASWSDVPVMQMEIREIAGRLDDGDRVLDVGCANGWSTLQLARSKVISIRGVDYVPEMVANARSRLAEATGELRGTVEFDVGDATSLDEPDGAYDRVVVIRAIINLGEWDNQHSALRECARVLRPGGKLLLSEATLQGWTRLNALRREWALSDIPMPSFNNYLDENTVVEALAPELELVELANFASTYFVGTRLLKPLLAAATGAPIDVADPSAEWNRWMSELPAWGDYGTQKLFVFRKR